MTKDIISMAREAFKFPDAMVWDAWMPSLERFAALVKAARDAELLEGVEMPEPNLTTTAFTGDGSMGVYYREETLRSTVAAAVAKKDAEMHQMGEDLIAIQTMHNEQKARLYEKCADLRNERDAIKAENERLECARDDARFALRKLREQIQGDCV